jgi:hypothetical protein
VRDFNYDELRKVYEVATPQEKKLLEPGLRRAAAKAKVKARSAPITHLPAFMRWAGRSEPQQANQ